MKDLSITLEDRPGRLADLGEAAGRAGINIEGMCATSGSGRAEVHVLVDDARPPVRPWGRRDRSRRRERRTRDRCREPARHLGEVARRVAVAGVNIGLLYATFGGVKLVLGVDYLDGARSAL